MMTGENNVKKILSDKIFELFSQDSANKILSAAIGYSSNSFVRKANVVYRLCDDYEDLKRRCSSLEEGDKDKILRFADHHLGNDLKDIFKADRLKDQIGGERKFLSNLKYCIKSADEKIAKDTHREEKLSKKTKKTEIFSYINNKGHKSYGGRF